MFTFKEFLTEQRQGIDIHNVSYGTDKDTSNKQFDGDETDIVVQDTPYRVGKGNVRIPNIGNAVLIDHMSDRAIPQKHEKEIYMSKLGIGLDMLKNNNAQFVAFRADNPREEMYFRTIVGSDFIESAGFQGMGPSAATRNLYLIGHRQSLDTV